jgi:hypothetical protein
MTSPVDHQPQTWPSDLRARVAPVLAVLGRVRSRRRGQKAVARFAVWLAVAGALLVPTVMLLRLDVADVPVALPLVLLLLLAAVHASWQRLPWQQLARQVDAQIDGKDTLATALWLADSGRADGWALVQAEAAVALASRVQPEVLEPWRRPRALPWLVAALLLLVVAIHVPLDALKQLTGVRHAQGLDALALDLPGGPQPFTSAAALLGEDATRLLEADAKMLKEIKAQVTDEPTKAWLGDVKKVVDGVADGRLDKRQALEMLAQLEAQKPAVPQNPLDAEEAKDRQKGEGAGEAQSPEQAAQAQEQKDEAVKNAVAEAAKAAAKAAPKGEEKKLLEEAAAKKDLGLLAKLAEKLANKNMSDKDLEQWIKAAEKFAGALKDQKLPEKFKDLADRVDRLQKKRAQEGGLGASDQERLKSARKELEQLKRENGDVLAAQHQVQRLERGAKSAADMLRRAQEEGRLDKKASAEEKKQAQEEMKRALRAAANEMRRENERQQDRQAQRIGQNRMRQVREALDKAGGKEDQARRQFDRKAAQDGENPERGQGEERLGQKGKKGQQESAEARDAKRMAEARRKQGQGEGEQEGEQGGKPRPGGQKLGQGKDGHFDRMEQIREGYEQNTEGPPGGQGAGDQAGDKREGHGTRPGKQRGRHPEDEQLKGQESAGPDIKKVFSDAARKGFAKQGWRDVYKEYSQVADDMLDQEQIPPGRRSVVRQYFELIRPRKGWGPR